jgi:MFS family permease
MFRSLASVNYRIWFAGALVSNIGTWSQRTAQDWIVLTELTNHDAAALGITVALQLGPQLLLVPVSGLIADRLNKRHILMATQIVMGLLGLGLGIIVLTGVAQLWIVYVFALALGITSAFDAPVRQTFVAELVSGANVSNAVALNSASFNAARTIGPAIAGLLVAVIGAGWVFIINSVTFAAVVISLKFIRISASHLMKKAPRAKGQVLAGFRYVRHRPDLLIIFVIVFIIGTFGFNYQIFTSTMATVEFGQGSAGFGLLSSIMAIGSVAGALVSASRDKPKVRLVFLACATFGLSALAAAFAPGYWVFAGALVLIGFSGQILMTTSNGTVQTTTDPMMRGRVMALYMAIFMGGTPIGAPLVGAIANTLGPRWALGVAAIAGFAAFSIGVGWLVVHRHMRLRLGRKRRPRLTFGPGGDETLTGSITMIVPDPAASLVPSGPLDRAGAALAKELEEDEALEEELALDEVDAKRT